MKRLFCRAAPLLAVWLAGCASGPEFDSAQYLTTPSPAAVVSDFGASRYAEVMWGGVIIGTRNLETRTQLEVLSYPLDRSQLPDLRASSTGRFIANSDIFLEPVDFAEGRVVTVTGTLTELTSGEIGAATATYPVVKADSVHLWPKGSGDRSSGVQFGVGFIFSN